MSEHETKAHSDFGDEFVIMDDDELAAEIKAKCESGDWESDHYEADCLLVMHLRTLGFNKSADAFEAVGKWYA